jgi:DNA primase
VITQQSINNILDATRIEDVISDYVSLKRRGANYTGLCPFHNERTPSFSVSATKGIFKCFGCGKGGDAVNFLMEHEHLSYPEALKHLAKKFNVHVEETITDDKFIEQQKEAESLYIVNKFAQEFYSQVLTDSDEGKAIGLSYFNERKFSPVIIQKFGLGYAPDASDVLYQTANSSGYSKSILLQAGLIGESDGRVYDFFRGRVIFPIHNLSGKVIAFAGRIMRKNEKTAKYINSRETDVYNKSKTLYAIHLARERMRLRDECLLTEGYADVISMHQYGFEHCVASSGTSLTQDQVRLIKRFTQNLTFIYDGDQAGINAAMRGLDIALEEGLNVKICIIPDGDDPDSYLNKYGATAMQDLLLNASKSFLHFQADLKLKHAGEDPVKKSTAILDIIKSIALIGEPVKRNLFIKQLSSIAEMNESLMVQEVNKARAVLIKKNTKSDDNITAGNSNAVEIPEQRSHTDVELVLEDAITRTLALFGNYSWDDNNTVADVIISHLADRDWINKKNESVLRWYYNTLNLDTTPTFHDMLHHQDTFIREFAQQISGEPYTLSERWESEHNISISTSEKNYRKETEQILNRLELCRIRNMIEENNKEITEAQRSADEEAITQSIKVKIQLDRMQTEIAKKLGMITALPKR